MRLFTICLLILLVPLAGWTQEKEKRIRLKEEVVVKIKYGNKDGEFGRKDLEQDGSITTEAFALIRIIIFILKIPFMNLQGSRCSIPVFEKYIFF